MLRELVLLKGYLLLFWSSELGSVHSSMDTLPMLSDDDGAQ
jgi:hypothetical protein